MENRREYMAASKRFKTKYPGVFYRITQRIGVPNAEEHVFYIVFKKDGKVFEEKAGRQYADAMTAAKASRIRVERIEGKRLSRKMVKEQQAALKKAELERNTIAQILKLYQGALPDRNWKTDISLYRVYLEEKFATKRPEDVTTLEVDAVALTMKQAGKSAQTIKHTLGLLRRIIRFGIKKGLCPAIDPATLYFEMPVVDNTKTECLTQEQLKRYLEALDKEPDQNAASLLRLALATGMRKGALLALQWADIDFEKGFVTLRGDVAKKGKTERIPLSESARTVLLHVQRTDSPFVFPGKDGGQRTTFTRIARRVRDAAGLPKDFRPLHGLRHAYASFLASSGKVDLYTLQKLLTHSSPQMT
ncbi:tyrosine-type recombinase/integrase [Oleidesulfovibrio sp.]|uniref:tyrosine-type recombinase/integrase n=1 Tax=Oleidesulfovibrio sp. TaxID=2909707 RepID=UPI003A8855B7